jgi:cobalt/nickel transport system ATP-binding protein
MSMPVIRLDCIDFAYEPGRPVLRQCSLLLDAGQRIALTGGNGSGKSTLLQLIVGLVRPTAGTIEVLGRARRVPADFYEVRCRVGFLFQDSDDQLFCPTVAEDVAFGPLNLGKSREETRKLVAHTLAAVGLTGYEDRITHKLSGGEKRLVALATVLAMEPEILLLDEPTGGLDETAADRTARLLETLPQAMIVASHDRDLLGRLTDSVLRLEQGQITAQSCCS